MTIIGKTSAVVVIILVLVALLRNSDHNRNSENHSDDFSSEAEENMPLMMAINNGDADGIKKQLRDSPELKEEFYGDSKIWGNLGSTLDYAIITGNPDSVQAILDSGVDVNQHDSEDRTPLHQAASLGAANVVSILIRNGAKVNAIDSLGFSPLFDAAQSGSIETARVLLEAGADSSLSTPDGQTAESIALRHNNAQIASLIEQSKESEHKHKPHSE
ncbi:ankyrin repeat domain-containing protein [Rubellicoccus peritrichatus]|uniref:Ankyrin repeat domain-containing protein n=1 Tax=Rubellicoccus peritrichatus TaxID=3080537 RepID=A0AAQ3LC15_9BACT|nr:ankyrin repeat domain-containing protein [Puniceicoccus sp. CR14]WOO42996.1 ankyrin repeat domain-containing protein [Puniceicoccus sp. CR14]